MCSVREIIHLEHFHVNRACYFGCAIVFFLFAVSTFFFGCGQKQYSSVKGGTPLKRTLLSKEELRSRLKKFEEFFTSNIKQSASEIDRLSPDVKHHKLTLMYRARFINALHNMLEQEDPLSAFIDVWVLSVRMYEYFETGQGSELFDHYQEIARNTAVQIKAEIETIAQEFLSEEIFGETQKSVVNFANANPIQGTFSKTIVYASETKKGEAGSFRSVVNLPLAPFRAMEGVDRGAAAIYKFSDTADRFSNVVEEMPESFRWQLLLLLYELEETNMTKSFLDSLETISESSKKIADASEKMPELIRQETSLLLEEIDESQANVQTTLDKTATTAESMEELVQKTDNLLRSLSETAESIEATAGAWQQAAEATTETLGVFANKEPGEKKESSFTINDLRLTAESITSAAAEIRRLNDELAGNTDMMSAHLRGFADVITVRISLLIVLVFLLVIALRYVRFRAGGQNEGPAK